MDTPWLSIKLASAKNKYEINMLWCRIEAACMKDTSFPKE